MTRPNHSKEPGPDNEPSTAPTPDDSPNQSPNRKKSSDRDGSTRTTRTSLDLPPAAEVKKSITMPGRGDHGIVTLATGRRKQAIARVRLTPGTGKVVVNDREFDEYFPSAVHRRLITEPLRVTGAETGFDIQVSLSGGGLSGQAGAFRLGIARALIQIDPEVRGAVKAAGLLTRDPRKKESKKYGLKKARKAPQYSKR